MVYSDQGRGLFARFIHARDIDETAGLPAPVDKVPDDRDRHFAPGVAHLPVDRHLAARETGGGLGGRRDGQHRRGGGRGGDLRVTATV